MGGGWGRGVPMLSHFWPDPEMESQRRGWSEWKLERRELPQGLQETQLPFRRSFQKAIVQRRHQ